MIILRPADFPSNIQFQNHFSEFLAFGYKSSIGTIDVRFPARDGSRQITPGSVGVSDGQTKLLIMAAIILFLEELELTWEDVKKDASLTAALATFTSLRCCYTEFANPSHHFLQVIFVVTGCQFRLIDCQEVPQELSKQWVPLKSWKAPLLAPAHLRA